jgi:hypothetical protein
MSTTNPAPEQFEAEVRIVAAARKQWGAAGGRDFEVVQEILADVPTLSMPPSGHCCPFCSRIGSMFCLAIAIERLRGITAR